ncbi:hypothetical protein EDC01DRAFT_23410 [Geopyxis carbonaria]|nr:hypothetical protein EDC01DRAFT_23410 [Geopyxis carbonaria]
MQSKSILFSALMVASAFLPVTLGQTSLDDVDQNTRDFWCQSQVAACPLLCGDLEKKTVKNECFPDNLFYQCLCSEGITPNLTEYSQTIPYFQCTIDLNACVKGCSGDPKCNTQCPKTHVCGASSPKKSNSTKTTSSATASASASATGDSSDDSGSGFASSDGSSNASSDSSGAGGLVISVGKAYGLGLVAVGIGAAFVGL